MGYDCEGYILIAILAWTYVHILTDDGMIFCKLDKWMDGKWIFKIFGCEYCLAGQLSLWYFLYDRWFDYNFIDHVLYIGLTIFLVKLINRIICH